MNRSGASLDAQAVPDFRAGRSIGPPEERNKMLAPAFDPQHREGVIHVVLETGEIIAVCLEGDFDLANAPTLGAQLDRALEGGWDVIVDLSEATFIDSNVIDLLLRTAKAAGREQSVVLQLGTAAIVERVVEITGIARVLPRAHDRQEAVRIIQQQAEAV